MRLGCSNRGHAEDNGIPANFVGRRGEGTTHIRTHIQEKDVSAVLRKAFGYFVSVSQSSVLCQDKTALGSQRKPP